MTTKLTITTRPAKCCAHSAGRYALSEVQAIPKTGGGAWLISTDGRVLAIAPAEGVCESVRRIPCATVVRRKRDVDPLEVVDYGQGWQSSAGATVGKETDGRFPNVSSPLRRVDLKALTPITIDARLLLNLAKAINATGASPSTNVTLFFNPNDPCSTIPVCGGVGFGAIMPVAYGDEPAASEVKSRDTARLAPRLKSFLSDHGAAFPPPKKSAANRTRTTKKAKPANKPKRAKA